MSKGNGRRKNDQGNGMDKFNGSCNGISNSNNSNDNQEFLSYSNQSKPNSLDLKSGSEYYINVPSDKSIREFKNKFR